MYGRMLVGDGARHWATAHGLITIDNEHSLLTDPTTSITLNSDNGGTPTPASTTASMRRVNEDQLLSYHVNDRQRHRWQRYIKSLIDDPLSESWIRDIAITALTRVSTLHPSMTVTATAPITDDNGDDRKDIRAESSIQHQQGIKRRRMDDTIAAALGSQSLQRPYSRLHKDAAEDDVMPAHYSKSTKTTLSGAPMSAPSSSASSSSTTSPTTRTGMSQTSTIGAIACNLNGEVASGISSGGIWLKLPGRIGHAAMFGAGCYAKNNNTKSTSPTATSTHIPSSASSSSSCAGVAVSISGIGEQISERLLAHRCCEITMSPTSSSTTTDNNEGKTHQGSNNDSDTSGGEDQSDDDNNNNNDDPYASLFDAHLQAGMLFLRCDTNTARHDDDHKTSNQHPPKRVTSVELKWYYSTRSMALAYCNGLTSSARPIALIGTSTNHVTSNDNDDDNNIDAPQPLCIGGRSFVIPDH
jgi:hypothetical protein